MQTTLKTLAITYIHLNTHIHVASMSLRRLQAGMSPLPCGIPHSLQRTVHSDLLRWIVLTRTRRLPSASQNLCCGESIQQKQLHTRGGGGVCATARRVFNRKNCTPGSVQLRGEYSTETTAHRTRGEGPVQLRGEYSTETTAHRGGGGLRNCGENIQQKQLHTKGGVCATAGRVFNRNNCAPAGGEGCVCVCVCVGLFVSMWQAIIVPSPVAPWQSAGHGNSFLCS